MQAGQHAHLHGSVSLSLEGDGRGSVKHAQGSAAASSPPAIGGPGQVWTAKPTGGGESRRGGTSHANMDCDIVILIAMQQSCTVPVPASSLARPALRYTEAIDVQL